MWEYLAFQLWDFVGGALRSDRDWKPADPMNDAGGAAGLLNARGAEGWELVSVVAQHDVNARDGMAYVAYMKRPITGTNDHN
jgi:hypothetical protein